MAQWEVDSEAPIQGTAPKTPAKTPAKWEVESEAPAEMGLGRQLLGNVELGGAAVGSIPHGLAHAAADIVNRLSGDYSGNTPWVDKHIPGVEPGAAGRELSGALGNSLTQTLDQFGLQKPLTAAAGGVNEFGQEPGTAGNFVRNVVAPVGVDVASLAGARAPIQGAVTKGVNAVRSGVQGAMDAAGVGTDWRAAGLRTGGAHPIARQIAGESGPEALIANNAKVGGTVAANEVGHSPTAPMSQTSMAEAAAPASAVFNRVATSLPEGPMSPRAQATLNSAGQPGGTLKPSLQVQAQIDATKQQLLDARTGQQHVENLRTLRQQGFANSGSEVPTEQELGKAQLQMANAVEQHIEDALPENGPVNIDQFRAARQQLAKNWAVRGALKGGDAINGGTVDLKALGRMEEQNPGVFTGGLKTLADFANGPGRQVVGLPEQYNPPSIARDVAGIFNVHRPVQATAQGLGGGVAARALLTGSTAKNIARAQAMFPPRPPGAFDPLPSAPLPSGRLVRPGETGSVGAEGTGQGANPNPSPAGQNGDLAGVLSQGVEQPGAPGLTSGPMGSPQGSGLPFRMSPEMVGAQPVQGGAPKLVPRFTDDYGNEVNPNVEPGQPITLGDRIARGDQPADRPASVLAQRPTVPNPKAEPSLGDLLADLRDYAAVKSQGVPEGIAARTAGPRTGPTKPWLVNPDKPGNDRGFENLMEDIHGEEPLSNNASGQTDVSQEFANCQSERQAAGVSRHRYDPTTDEMVPMHSTSARDPSSVKGRPVFDRDADGNYTVVDRGGLSPSAINGILARMKSLGDRFAAGS